MIVIDASVLTGALTDDGRVGQACRAELSNDAHWAAPDHLVVEAFSAIRRLHLGAKITGQRAEEALNALATAVIDRVDIVPLLPGIWSCTPTCPGTTRPTLPSPSCSAALWSRPDQRLSLAPGLRCDVRVIER